MKQAVISTLTCTLAAAGAMATPALFAQNPVRARNLGLGQISGLKVALVIGNADYPMYPLRNPVKDSRSVASSLADLGFSVIQRENSKLPDMLDAMKEFWRKGRDANARVFYYAGHGLQFHGENYLLPVDAALKTEDDISRQAASVSDLLKKLETISKGVNILIIDACRTFPVAGRTKTRGINGRSTDSGLAEVIAPQGTLIAFSTAPGAIALDGADENSPYTQYLIENLKTPGLPVEQMFKRVRIKVFNATQKKQIPWESNSLLSDFCFRTGDAGQCPTNEFGG